MQDYAKDLDNRVRDTKLPRIDPSQIKGWGIDADPENDPTYPMRIRENETTKSYDWERPEQQTETVEVLHSNERPNLSAVFGTSEPPAGLSGMIRRGAFKYSENSYGHWLPLMLADRVQMIEGVVEDLAHGQIPNIPGERGWNAEWQHNRTNFVTKVLIGAAVAGLAVAIVSRKKDKFNQLESD